MAVTVEGKLELFKKVLFEHVEEDWLEKRKKLTEAMEHKFEEKKKEYEEQRKEIIEDAKIRAEMKRKKIIAKAQDDAQQEIMKKREECFNKMIEDIKAYSREFVKDERYKEFLKSSLSRTLNTMEGKNLKALFTHADINKLESFISTLINQWADKKNIEIKICEEDIIGGFIIEDGERGIIADFSIKTLIDENKEYIGKLLYERLDEVLKQ